MKKRYKLRNRRRITRLLLSLAALAFVALRPLAGCHADDGTVAPPSTTGDLTAVIIPDTLRAQIVEYAGMTVSFNPARHIPNWVAWELTAEETLGTVPRAKGFTADLSVAGCPEPWEYSYSGYDRGHIAPAGDMKWSREAMEQSFYMTNVCPQVKSFNSGVWARLEEKCRTWAQADSAIIIVAGPVMTDPVIETIGDTHIAVPQRFFKVILSPYADPPRAIGFLMNNGSVPGGMQAAAVSVDAVEEATGYDFFSALPDSVEKEVESQCRFHYWSTLKPRR